MSPLFRYKGKLLKRDNKLATSKNCCCEECKQCYCFCGFKGDGVNIGDKAHARTYTVPNEFSLPVKVTIEGVVDDVWVLDGDGTVDRQNPNTPAHIFQYEWTQEERTFTIEALDTFGANISLGYTLCIMPLNTNPTRQCSPKINASNDESCKDSIMEPYYCGPLESDSDSDSYSDDSSITIIP